MRYIASRNYQCFFVDPLRRKKKWKLLEYGERSSEATTTTTTMLRQGNPEVAFEWKEQRRERRKGRERRGVANGG